MLCLGHSFSTESWFNGGRLLSPKIGNNEVSTKVSCKEKQILKKMQLLSKNLEYGQLLQILRVTHLNVQPWLQRLLKFL